MPVINNIVAVEKQNLLIQGLQFRAAAILDGVHAGAIPYTTSVYIQDNEYMDVRQLQVLVADDEFLALPDFAPVGEVLRSPFAGTMVSNNTQIATPCGALIPHRIGSRLMGADFVQHSGRWVIAGITRDSVGAVLGNCAVTMLETSRIAVGQVPVVAQTVSDGSGNYSVEVPGNTAYQGIAYKVGVTDGSGASLNTLTPTQV
jgi:hypothetical protein